MTEVFMITSPRNTQVDDWYGNEKALDLKVTRRLICTILQESDVKKWTIGKETGHNGYEHWQIRCKVSRPNFFDIVHAEAPFMAIFKAQDEWKYERKEHYYTSSEDTTEILKIRYGVLRENQKKILKELKRQGNRNVTVCFDPRGGNGKTHLVLWLYEHGHALVVPRASTTAEKLSAYVCSTYDSEEIICIDIPRSRPVTPELYEAIEELKDGLVFDHRYSGKCRNIRGVKVLVTTNAKMDIEKLSTDRWQPIDPRGNRLKLEDIATARGSATKKTKHQEG